MVRECHQARDGDGDDYGSAEYRPARGGSITSITSRQELIAYIGHDEQEWFHRLDDAGHPVCGNVKRRDIVRTPHIKRELFASTPDVKWCPLCKRRLGMQ